MAKIVTNTGRTPLGIGPLSVLLEPGQTEAFSDAAWKQATAHPVVTHWVESGSLEVEDGKADPETEAAIAEAEAEAEATKAPALPPAIPAPAKSK